MHVTKRRGATLVFIAVALPIFLIVAIMAIDIAYMQLVRTEHRAAVDAAAKASAEALSRGGDSDVAIAAGIDLASQNQVGGRSLELDSDDFQFGRASRLDDGSWTFLPDEEPLTAVRVRSDLSGGSSVRLLLGWLVGVDRFSPQRVSTAAYADHDVCLVVDRSHSMCFDLYADWSYPPDTPTTPSPVCYPPHATLSRWAQLEQAIGLYVSTVLSMDTSQHVSLVTWASEVTASDPDAQLTGYTFPAAQVDVPLSADISSLHDAILARGDHVMLGATDMSAGIDLGTLVLTGPDARPEAVKTMIVLTDGQWNRGRSPVLAAEDAKAAGITVHTVTFLDTADQSDMIAVADATGGRHYHASDGAALQQVFYELAVTLPVVLTD